MNKEVLKLKNFTLGVILGSIIGGTTGAIAAGEVLRGTTLLLTPETNEEGVAVIAHAEEDGGGLMVNDLRNSSFSHMMGGKVSVSDTRGTLRAVMSEEGFLVLDSQKRIAATLTADGLTVVPVKQRKPLKTN